METGHTASVGQWARTLGGKCLSNATYWMLVIHHGGELQLNAFLMPACLTGSLSLLQYTVDAPLHLNAMKCKGSALWTLVEGLSQTRARPLTRVTTSEAPFLDKITPSSLFHLPGLPLYMVPPFRQ